MRALFWRARGPLPLAACGCMASASASPLLLDRSPALEPGTLHVSARDPAAHIYPARGILAILAWFPKNPPWVGQSFGTERLGFSLTSRLATPLDWPSHHTRPGAPVFFFHPESAGGSRFRIRQHGAKRKKEDRQIRDRRVLIGRGLAR